MLGIFLLGLFFARSTSEQTDSKATSSLHTTERKAVGAHEFKENQNYLYWKGREGVVGWD